MPANAKGKGVKMKPTKAWAVVDRETGEFLNCDQWVMRGDGKFDSTIRIARVLITEIERVDAKPRRKS